MAVYKVPQDVEADDKLIAFLSMKQFIFVVIAALLSFAAFTLAKINLLLFAPFLPFIAFFAILGLYQRKDQPAEIYLLAALGFLLKPHKRVWSQDGVLETVHITVPKKVFVRYSDGLSKTEVVSNLNKLSMLMDTRGWATKNTSYQTNVVVPNDQQSSSDRLIAPVSKAQIAPVDIRASDDVLDTTNNPVAKNLEKIMEKVAKKARKEALENMRVGQTTNLNATSQPASPNLQPPVQANGATPHYNPAPTGIHQKVLNPVHNDQSYQQNKQAPPEQTPVTQSVDTDISTMTSPTPDVILELANARDDNLSVETIAKEANKKQSLAGDEMIILH